MLDENEGEYLSFKNLPNPSTSTYRSQVVYTTRTAYSINPSHKPNPDQVMPSKLSKQKHLITPKSKGQPNSVLKSPKSHGQVISFSTDSTKKNHFVQTPKKNASKPIQAESNENFQDQQIQGRLIKAKSHIDMLKTMQKHQKEQSLSKKLIEEVMEQLPFKYRQDFKNYQNQSSNDKYSSLIQTIRLYEAKIHRLQKEIQLKNAQIKSLQKNDTQNFSNQNHIQSYLQPQNRYFQEENRQSVRRLLNMLKSTDQYKEFSKFALDDNGIVLLSEANKKNKTKIDAETELSSKKPKKLHYCSCNKEFIPQPYLWVPESIYEYGKEFLKNHQGENGEMRGFMSKSQYELFLYDLNKMWRQREKRIVNTITHEKNLQIEKLKRKYNIIDRRLNSGRKNII